MTLWQMILVHWLGACSLVTVGYLLGASFRRQRRGGTLDFTVRRPGSEPINPEARELLNDFLRIGPPKGAA